LLKVGGTCFDKRHERNYFKSRSVRSFGKLGGDLSAPTSEKILTSNPRRLYHF